MRTRSQASIAAVSSNSPDRQTTGTFALVMRQLVLSFFYKTVLKYKAF